MGRQIPLLMMAVAFSLTGCAGGSDAPEPPAGPEISKAQLIERADAICRQDLDRLDARLKRAPKPTPESAATTGVALVFEMNADTIHSGAKKIEALGTPTADAELLEDYLDERTTAGNALRSAAKAAREGNLAALQGALETYGRNNAQALATRFGFKECGLGATNPTSQTPSAG